MNIVVVYLILYLLAAISFLVFAVAHPPVKINLLGLGVFFWALVPLIQTIRVM